MAEVQRKRYLDVLKAVAIIAVVLYHSGFLTYGYLGVDVFLVIGGFLVTKSLMRRMEPVNSFSSGFRMYFRFLLDRVIRLLPLILLAGLVSMIFGFFFYIDDTYESLTQSVIASDFFANNVVELLSRGNYWSGDAQFDPLMHTWYVGVLMQFYVLCPLLFFLAGIDRKNPRRTLFLLFLTLTVLSFALFLSDPGSPRSFYLLPARFFELGAGSLVALSGVSQKERTDVRAARRIFVYALYAALLALIVIPSGFIPAGVKRFLVTLLTVMLILSPDVLENKVTSNPDLGLVGTASYSIYIWHQVVLAIFRNTVSTTFTAVSYAICLLIIAAVSLMSYRFIERPISRMSASPGKSMAFYTGYGSLFVLLNTVTLLIYLHAGVVRDIPELDVEFAHPQRGAHIAYTARGNQHNHSFQTDKRHWLVIGNSYGLDFINVILESEIADSVEISFCRKESYKDRKSEDRFFNADRVFIAYRGLTEDLVRDIELRCLAGGLSLENVWILGEKYFGENVNLIYSKRFRKDYYQTTVRLPESLRAHNDHFREQYATRFIDLLELTTQNGEDIPVFTDNNALYSWDCLHLMPAGARALGQKISWEKYL